ncbi:MAG: hypothetical protein AVDCRST_MAG74-3392, partial [uncultured Pyrinomonadaceae bacterium]
VFSSAFKSKQYEQIADRFFNRVPGISASARYPEENETRL